MMHSMKRQRITAALHDAKCVEDAKIKAVRAGKSLAVWAGDVISERVYTGTKKGKGRVE